MRPPPRAGARARARSACVKFVNFVAFRSRGTSRMATVARLSLPFMRPPGLGRVAGFGTGREAGVQGDIHDSLSGGSGKARRTQPTRSARMKKRRIRIWRGAIRIIDYGHNSRSIRAVKKNPTFYEIFLVSGCQSPAQQTKIPPWRMLVRREGGRQGRGQEGQAHQFCPVRARQWRSSSPRGLVWGLLHVSP